MEWSEDKVVARLRAEVLAPDWQLSDNRLQALQQALPLMIGLFKGRAKARALVEMALQTSRYIGKRRRYESKALDLLKECLAHIVSLYEEPDGSLDDRCYQQARKGYDQLRLLLRQGA